MQHEHHFPDLAGTLLTPNEAASRLGISHRTLERWRAERRGPPFIIVGPRAVRYDPGDLATWLRANRRTSATIGDCRGDRHG